MTKTSHRGLYITASLLWLIAGSKVLSIAYEVWDLASYAKLYWAFGAYIFFALGIFPRVVAKNIRAIQQSGQERLPIYRCFTPSSWAVMAFMIALGIALRYSGWVDFTFIAGFYTGLGIALIGSIRTYLMLIFAARSGNNKL
ncbi:MAG: hypothetical protein Q4A64_04285 [Porphyromonadaceae bacterium]|nr:hypothetical protein [Porphyromonadaceae bacterium]